MRATGSTTLPDVLRQLSTSAVDSFYDFLDAYARTELRLTSKTLRDVVDDSVRVNERIVKEDDLPFNTLEETGGRREPSALRRWPRCQKLVLGFDEDVPVRYWPAALSLPITGLSADSLGRINELEIRDVDAFDIGDYEERVVAFVTAMALVVSRLPGIQCLNLSDMGEYLWDEVLNRQLLADALAGLPRLHSLSLKGLTGLKALGGEACRGLTKLEIVGAVPDLADHGDLDSCLAGLQALQSLKEFVLLRAMAMNGRGLSSMSSMLRRFMRRLPPTVERFEFSMQGLSPSGSRVFSLSAIFGMERGHLVSVDILSYIGWKRVNTEVFRWSDSQTYLFARRAVDYLSMRVLASLAIRLLLPSLAAGQRLKHLRVQGPDVACDMPLTGPELQPLLQLVSRCDKVEVRTLLLLQPPNNSDGSPAVSRADQLKALMQAVELLRRPLQAVRVALQRGSWVAPSVIGSLLEVDLTSAAVDGAAAAANGALAAHGGSSAQSGDVGAPSPLLLPALPDVVQTALRLMAEPLKPHDASLSVAPPSGGMAARSDAPLTVAGPGDHGGSAAVLAASPAAPAAVACGSVTADGDGAVTSATHGAGDGGEVAADTSSRVLLLRGPFVAVLVQLDEDVRVRMLRSLMSPTSTSGNPGATAVKYVALPEAGAVLLHAVYPGAAQAVVAAARRLAAGQAAGGALEAVAVDLPRGVREPRWEGMCYFYMYEAKFIFVKWLQQAVQQAWDDAVRASGLRCGSSDPLPPELLPWLMELRGGLGRLLPLDSRPGRT